MVFARPILPVYQRMQSAGVCGSPTEQAARGEQCCHCPRSHQDVAFLHSSECLCPGPRPVASLESGSWGDSSRPAHTWWEQERGKGRVGWRLARPCPAGASREVALGLVFPCRDVKMLLQGRGIPPGARGEIPCL